MKHSRYFWLTLALMLWTATHGFASPGSPKLPSTLNFQSLNEIGCPTLEADWAYETGKLDMVIASDHIAGLRAHNTDVYLLQYMLVHTVLTNDSVELGELSTYAANNSYDPESAFLHYYENTVVTYSDGTSETIKGYGGGTAATLKDARVKNRIWTSFRYIYNLKSPLFQNFKGYYFRKMITTGNKPDGIFVDEVSPALAYYPTINSGGRVIEYANRTPAQYAADYQADMTPAFAKINSLMGSDHPTYPGGDRVLLPNISEYVSDFVDLGINGADGELTETWMQVCQPRVTITCDAAKQLADKGRIMIISQACPDPEVPAPGNYSSAMDRHQMFSLSNYWLAKQGRFTYYQQKAGLDSPLLSSFWCKARDFDIGAPNDALYSVWKTGTDSKAQNYTIYKRQYTKALILSRPKIGWDYSDYSTLCAPYDLGGTYRLLHADATLGPEITKIGLAMGEAVTLLNVSGGTPPTDTTAPVISNVTSSAVTANSASVAWSTDEPATGAVEYGTTTSYGAAVAASNLASSQSLPITGLAASTIYHYRVTATDSAGNKAVGVDKTFTTAQASGGANPTGFIRSWAALGSFGYTGAGHNTDYIGEATIHPSIGDTTVGKVWSALNSTTDNIDLFPLFSPNEHAIAYLNTYVYSPIQRGCQVRFAVDDAAKVFLNGVLIDDNTGYRSPDPDTDKLDVTLKTGWNQLLVKAENFTAGWTMYARITDAQGNLIPDLTYQVNYPTGAGAGTPKINVSIAVDKLSAKVGDLLVYTVTYTNTGNGPAASAVVSANVDPHVGFVSATGGGTYDATTKMVKWNVGSIQAGASATMTYTAVVQ